MICLLSQQMFQSSNKTEQKKRTKLGLIIPSVDTGPCLCPLSVTHQHKFPLDARQTPGIKDPVIRDQYRHSVKVDGAGRGSRAHQASRILNMWGETALEHFLIIKFDQRPPITFELLGVARGRASAGKEQRKGCAPHAGVVMGGGGVSGRLSPPAGALNRCLTDAVLSSLSRCSLSFSILLYSIILSFTTP